MHQPTTAPLKRRLAALVYELLLTGAITCLAALPAGFAAILLNRIWPQLASLAVCLIFLAAWWWYYRTNWLKQGQTLPMRVWRIGLVDRHNKRPPLRQLKLRFMWACVLIIFVPLLAYAVLHYNGIPPKAAFGASLCWWILPWGFALFNRDRQFLYDFLSGTRLIALPKN